MIKKEKSSSLKILLILTLFIVLFLSFANSSDTSLLGYNSLGEVVKHDYSHYGDADTKIAIISGMHSRENLHAVILPEICKFISLFNKVEIVNYQVTVTKNPGNFEEGRVNGESLVNEFVVKDIGKNDFDLVIIGHDHEEGYGEGYYIATPSMDEKSINLANKVVDNIGFNYYKRDTSSVVKSSSINTVDNPIVNTNTPLFVYEIPENDFILFAFINSYRLINESINILNN